MFRALCRNSSGANSNVQKDILGFKEKKTTMISLFSNTNCIPPGSKHPCDKCGKEFSSQQALTSHSNNYHGPVQVIIQF